MMKRQGIGLFQGWGKCALWIACGIGFAALQVQSAKAKESDEYDFSWLDPDKKIYVLQNRRYTKAGKPTVSLSGIYGLSQVYRTVVGVEPRLAYYFSESWGVEVFYTGFSSSPNQNDKILKQATSTIPAAIDLKNQSGILVHWVPWYSKLNFFNQILYFDWGLNFGFGTLNAQVDTNRTVGGTSNFIQKSYTAYYIGTTQQFHITKNWFARLDVTGAIYQREIYGDGGDKAWFSNFNAGLGVGYRF